MLIIDGVNQNIMAAASGAVLDGNGSDGVALVGDDMQMCKGLLAMLLLCFSCPWLFAATRMFHRCNCFLLGRETVLGAE